jgi:hypothetical protein
MKYDPAEGTASNETEHGPFSGHDCGVTPGTDVPFSWNNVTVIALRAAEY